MGFSASRLDKNRYAFASSGFDSLPSGSVTGSSATSFSFADSAASVNFIAPTNKPVKRPPLISVLRKNSHVSGQPEVPLIKAVIQPRNVLVYSGFPKGLNNQEAVLVMR